MPYCPPLPAETPAVQSEPFAANAPDQTWPFAPSSHEVTGGSIPSPLSPPAGQDSFHLHQHTATYKSQAQPLYPPDSQRPVQFSHPGHTLPTIASPATSSFPSYQFLYHPSTQETGVPVRAVPNGPRTFTLLNHASNSTAQPPATFTGYYSPSLTPTCSPPAAFPSNNPHTPFTVNSHLNHHHPDHAMPDQRGHLDSYGRYINIVTNSDDIPIALAHSADLSDVEETVVAEKHPDTVPSDAGRPPQDSPFGSPSHSSSVVDLSYPCEPSPDESKQHGLPSRRSSSFVNLSLRDGQLYDETKCVDVTDIVSHSFEQQNERKQRGPLTEAQREAARKAREWHACLRCRSQRVRVSVLP